MSDLHKYHTHEHKGSIDKGSPSSKIQSEAYGSYVPPAGAFADVESKGEDIPCGLGEKGVQKDSHAAKVQSEQYKNHIPKGSEFSKLQSEAMKKHVADVKKHP